jgi:hypothetical protein
MGEQSTKDPKRTGAALREWIKVYARPKCVGSKKYIVDEFDNEFYLILDCEDDPESPETHGTCDVLVVPYGAEAIRLKANCDKYGVMRIFAALGIGRFPIKVKEAFYDANKILRKP